MLLLLHSDAAAKASHCSFFIAECQARNMVLYFVIIVLFYIILYILCFIFYIIFYIIYIISILFCFIAIFYHFGLKFFKKVFCLIIIHDLSRRLPSN